METEDVADGQSDHPIPDQIGNHRDASLPKPAKSARYDGLNAIEQLEASGNGE
jgi:hypothetical protein